MNHQDAVKLALAAQRLYLDNFTEPEVNQIHTALCNHVEQHLPADTVAAVVKHDEGLPLILAADGKYLHAVDVVLPMPDDAPATARGVMRRLDPERCRVELQTRYRSRGFGWACHSTWVLTIEDLDLTVETDIDEDGEHTDSESRRREALCRHIAQAIGWRFDGPAIKAEPGPLERLAEAEAAQPEAA